MKLGPLKSEDVEYALLDTHVNAAEGRVDQRVAVQYSCSHDSWHEAILLRCEKIGAGPQRTQS